MTEPVDALLWQITASQLPQPVTEHRFHPKRRWRFDLCWPVRKIALEVEGGIWVNGRHTRPAGYQADCVRLLEILDAINIPDDMRAALAAYRKDGEP